MVTASDAENSANKTQLLDCFCSWVHYYLLNPTAKGIEQLARFGRSSCCRRSSYLVEWHSYFATYTALTCPCSNARWSNRCHPYHEFVVSNPHRGSIDPTSCVITDGQKRLYSFLSGPHFAGGFNRL